MPTYVYRCRRTNSFANAMRTVITPTGLLVAWKLSLIRRPQHRSAVVAFLQSVASMPCRPRSPVADMTLPNPSIPVSCDFCMRMKTRSGDRFSGAAVQLQDLFRLNKRGCHAHHVFSSQP